MQASILHYAKLITQAAAEGSPIVDCVITVPAWFGASQRKALLDAADLAGLNVLSLINTHAAAALQYGIERDFTDKPEHVIFYDLGAGSTEVRSAAVLLCLGRQFGGAAAFWVPHRWRLLRSRRVVVVVVWLQSALC